MPANPEDLRFQRNLGFWSQEEDELIRGSTVAIAGAGGDGGMLAVQLARMGVGELRLADPDPFEIENCNRQAVCTDKTVGVNKAVAVGDYVQSINRPGLTVSIFDQGITKANVAEFVAGADLVIDETEFTMHVLAVMLARAARAEHVPNMTALNVGFGAIVTTYHPDGPKLEERLGFTEAQSLEDIEAQTVGIDRWLPYLPPYADLGVLQRVAEGEISAPSVAPGVAIAAGVGATEALLNLVQPAHNNRRAPIYAPSARIFDAMTMESSVVSYTPESHNHYLDMLVENNMAGLAPIAGYSQK